MLPQPSEPAPPLYHQVKEYIRDLIDNRVVEVDQQIPTEDQLMERFGVSRITVKRAVNDLVSEGLLVRHRGRGTFVARPKFTQNLIRVDSLTQIAVAQGATINSRLVAAKWIKVGKSLAEKLGVQENSEALEIQRLRYVNHEPIIFHRTFYPATILAGRLPDELPEGSMYRFLEQELGLKVTEQENTLQIAIADDYEASMFQIKPGAPLFLATIRTFAEKRRPIEVVKVLYRGDRCQFIMTPRSISP